MNEQLRVEPVDLHMSADHMDMHHSEFHAAHTEANTAIEDAQSGWIGASGAALRAKLIEWQETSIEVAANISSHGTRFRTAASQYAQTDAEQADVLHRQV